MMCVLKDLKRLKRVITIILKKILEIINLFEIMAWRQCLIDIDSEFIL